MLILAKKYFFFFQTKSKNKLLMKRGGFTKQLIIIINLRVMPMPYPISKVGSLKVSRCFLACIEK